MLIRNATPEDKTDYLAIQKEAFPTIDSVRDARFFDEKVANQEAFVIEEDAYAGHLCFGTHVLSPPFIGSVFVEELAVREAYRGRGFGTALLDRLVAYCKERGIRSIHLGTGNDRAARYYEQRGFRKVGWLEDIDPDSEYDHGQVIYAIMVSDWNPAESKIVASDKKRANERGANTIEQGRYQHYKGNTYTVLGVARHSETFEELVVYRAEYVSDEFGDQALWARPKAMFLETVDIEGERAPRFAYVGNDEA